jgi:hypothetical protein
MRWFPAAILLFFLAAELAAADDLKVDCTRAQSRVVSVTCPPDKQNDASSGAELKTLQLQNLMSRRQSANQFVTDLLQEEQETTDSVADHIGN